MAEAFAGFVCGYALALVLAPIVAIALLRARAGNTGIARVLPEGTSLVALSVIVHVFGLLTLTALGMIMGLLLAGLEENNPAGGLGSPNRVYTIVVIAIAAIAVVPMAVVVRRARTPLVLGGALFVVTFGWVTPWLAQLGAN